MLLTPYRVLDLTGPLGYLTGRVLGDLGATVVKVEPPGGDEARRWWPRLPRDGMAGDSLFWLALNAGKRGTVLDLEDTADRRILRGLTEEADFVLESFPPGTLDRWKLGYDALRLDNPSLILVSITPFGQSGPYRDFLASDLEIMALGGAMSLIGEEDGEPMRVSLPQAPMWVGVEAAVGALTALAYRGRTGRGQHVDVSAQVAVLAALAHAPAFYDLNGVCPERAGIYVTGRSVTGAKMRVFWPCRDGWINFIIYGGAAGRHTNQQLVAWMDEKGMAPDWLKRMDWSVFNVPSLTQAQVDDLEAPVTRFLETLTKEEFLEGAVQRGILGYPVSTVEDIDRYRHLAARGFWQDIRDPVSGQTLRYPGGFAIINDQRLKIAGPAPALQKEPNIERPPSRVEHGRARA